MGCDSEQRRELSAALTSGRGRTLGDTDGGEKDDQEDGACAGRGAGQEFNNRGIYAHGDEYGLNYRSRRGN